MSITKAILLTLGLVLVFAIIQMGILFPTKYLFSSYPIVSENLMELSTVLGFLFSYLILFYFFWKQEFQKIRIPKPLNLQFSLLIYLLLIAIGLELFDRPFWDSDKIVNFYSDSQFLVDYPGFYEYDSLIIYKIFSAVIIAPIFEELFFRKFLLGNLLKRYKRLTGLIISSFCFAIIHIETPDNLIPTFLFGLISGLIFIKTKRILYSIILHFIMNSFWLISLLIGAKYYQWVYSLNFNFIYWTLPLIGGILLIIGVRKITTANII